MNQSPARSMTMKDHLQLDVWIRAKVSLAEVESVDAVGLVGNERFTPAAVRAFRLLWRWSALRVSDDLQARYAERCGRAALNRRIERCRERMARITGRAIRW